MLSNSLSKNYYTIIEKKTHNSVTAVKAQLFLSLACLINKKYLNRKLLE